MKVFNSSIRKNIIYQVGYELLHILLPILTSPYVSRVIGVEGLGIYSYSYSIAFYFVLFSMLGIKNYGNRVIAQARDHDMMLDTAFSSLLCIHIIISLVFSIAYLVFVFLTETNKIYLTIQFFYVISAMFDISWFYFGIEQFKISVIRNTIIKILTVICTFIFVRKREDLWAYCLVMSLSNLISQLALWLPLKKYVHFARPSIAQITKHVKPLLILFIPAIAVSLYKYMDKIMLGAMSSITQLGFYENAEKIINIPNTIIAAFGTVMLPKMSNILHNRKWGEASRYIEQSMRYVICIAIAFAFGLASVGQVFAPVFWGDSFSPSGIIIVGLSITIPFISFANVIRTQFLIPTEKDKEYLGSVIIGAAVNLIINGLLIKSMGAMGATIGTIAAEATVCVLQVLAVRKEIAITKYITETVPFLFLGIAMGIIVYKIGQIRGVSITTLIIQVAVGGLFYGICSLIYLYCIRDSILRGILQGKSVKRNRFE